jgi:hypothetical protein
MRRASAAVTDTLTRKRVNADAVLDFIHPGGAAGPRHRLPVRHRICRFIVDGI